MFFNENCIELIILMKIVLKKLIQFLFIFNKI